jgi:hypothetical protein
MIVVGMMTLLSSAMAIAQPPKKTLGDLVHELADQEVERYEINLQDKDVTLTRVPRSLLRWSNATRNTTFGDTYIWTHQGCARAIISIFAIGAPPKSIAAECQSLTDGAFKMRRNDVVVWAPMKSGIAPKPFENARGPAGSAALRLVQMNAISRQFRGEFAPHTTPGEFTQLRLLPKPLFRYESENADVLDGAVYGFVDATDPEMLLVIEARREGGEMSWVYSPARSRHDHLRLYLDGKVVWDVPRLAPPWDNIRNPSEPYFNLRLEKIIPPAEWQQISERFDR